MVESPIIEGFQDAREKVLQESKDIGNIYRAMRKPGNVDVYNAWVKNMDVVANSYSWGKDKTAFRTRLMKVANRIVGVGAATLTAPEMVIDALTWLPRQIPVVGHFIPDHLFRRANIRLAESAKNEALVYRGLAKVVDKPAEVISETAQNLALGFGHPVERFSGKLAAGMLYPKAK